MSPRKPADTLRLWRPIQLPGVECLRAAYRCQHFARHSHRRYCVGVIEAGALGFFYRGQNLVAPAGTVNFANPDVPHTGQPAAPGGWTYRMFYLEPDVMTGAAAQMAGHAAAAPPFFPAGVMADTALARAIGGLHLALDSGRISRLDAETRLLDILAALIRRHSVAPPMLRPAGREPAAVNRVRRLIEDRCGENLSLADLSREAGLSPFHLIRVFQRHIGLTPHNYMTQQRIRRARALLAAGNPVADTALAVGFFDQSHLTHHFRRITGVTPGRYRKILQDDCAARPHI